jgi:hypothetical protein
MKKLFFAVVLLASVAAFGQSPFDGTWMVKLDTAKLPTKPDQYLLNKTTYECLTCVPKVTVKANGTDQKVTGHPYYDMISVRAMNASSVEIVQKKEGKVMSRETLTVSADGKSLDDKGTDTTGTQPVTWESTAARVSAGPAGSHALSGSWRTEKINSVSNSGLFVTFQSTGNGIKMSDQNGRSYDARFDGNDYPVLGDPGHTRVWVKRIATRMIEETDRRGGKIVGVYRMTVSTDGNSISVEYIDKEHETTTTYTMERKS